MIAILLYLIGLISAVVTVAVAAFEAPAIYTTLVNGFNSGADWLALLAGVAGRLNWALTPFIGGLLLMGFGRVIMLLGSISRALRGPA
ncbi:MAG: hypothetical protein EOP22_14300 [Hyphomicrobiales bacterium]|nr:MAG: hypothetical protein EOP22_14300 [Hyphomicrobiales bacterium]